MKYEVQVLLRVNGLQFHATRSILCFSPDEAERMALKQVIDVAEKIFSIKVSEVTAFIAITPS